MMNDKYDMPKEIFCLGVGLLLASGAIASFFYARSTSLLPVVSEQLHNDAALLITEAFTRYRVLLEEINSDRKIIIQALKDYNSESEFLKNTLYPTTIKTYQSIYPVFYTPVPNEVMLMWDELDQLMIFHPKTNFGASVTSSEINEAYDALESNHSQLVTLAATLLPNLSALLNEAKSEHETHQFGLK